MLWDPSLRRHPGWGARGVAGDCASHARDAAHERPLGGPPPQACADASGRRPAWPLAPLADGLRQRLRRGPGRPACRRDGLGAPGPRVQPLELQARPGGSPVGERREGCRSAGRGALPSRRCQGLQVQAPRAETPYAHADAGSGDALGSQGETRGELRQRRRAPAPGWRASWPISSSCAPTAARRSAVVGHRSGDDTCRDNHGSDARVHAGQGALSPMGSRQGCAESAHGGDRLVGDQRDRWSGRRSSRPAG
jgi:hypothetical protein